MTIEVTPDLLARYDKPGPRYTSYPTALSFSPDVGADSYAERLEAAAEQSGDPLSLYVHLPFCEHRCSFCACHVVVTRNRDTARPYIDRLVAEAGLVAARLGERRTLSQYHWGGGTPTYFAVDDLRRVHEATTAHFELGPGAEASVEVDPRVTTPEHLEALRGWGFNRVSLGLQDATALVQEAIGRGQTLEQTEDLMRDCRHLAFDSVNIDLVYGLPAQTPASFRETLDAVVGLRPDRLAVYSFALVPWMRPHQQRLDMERLPPRPDKLRMLADAIERLTAAGYLWVGMDHFALPDDELVTARSQGRLYRNFMGYTVSRAPDMVGLGSSAIGDVAGAYVQGHRRLHSYYEAVDAAVLPVERGYVRSADDDVRRYVIGELLCNLQVRWAAVADRFGVEPPTYFAAELARLEAELPELATCTSDGVELTELGGLFPRVVAMVFDKYLASQSTPERAFSRTV